MPTVTHCMRDSNRIKHCARLYFLGHYPAKNSDDADDEWETTTNIKWQEAG